MPGSMRAFAKWRSRDINVESGVASTSGSLNYYIFNEPALNGFLKDFNQERGKAKNDYFIKEIRKVRVRPLSEVLLEHLNGQEIDFLTVDVEGLDLEVLKSNDWSKYRPKVVLAEIFELDMSDLENNELTAFMQNVGYAFYAKTVNTVFFVDTQNHIH